MNEAEQKRNQRAEQLRVYQTDQEDFWVESADAKIAYRVFFNLERGVGKCTCSDFQTKVKSDGDYKCKHLLATADAICNSDVESSDHLEKIIPQPDERFIIEIDGKKFIQLTGLIDLGHKKGISKIEVEIVQLPAKENDNFAVCKAVITSRSGDTFSDVGDASPMNTNSRVAKHLLRMASSRAIGRALRSYTNAGYTCLEELGDINEVIGSSKVVDIKSRKPAQTKKTQTTKTAATDKSNGNGTKKKVVSKPKTVEKTKPDSKKPDNGNGSDQPKMSQAQQRALMNLSRRRCISLDQLEDLSEEMFSSKVENLSTSDAASFIRQLQQSA